MSDFDRNVWCLLGVPIDVVSYRQALDAVATSVADRRACFISTPNLNFIINALNDREFLGSVIGSDLVLLDGMPPVWLARLAGISGIQKVSGSNLFESLWEHSPLQGRKIKVFLFGGEEGVAAQACERINRLARGLECVGYYFPGFGSIEDMSSDEVIRQVNESEADFVVVALGARKGQAWIMANRDRLQAPLISHLGAVVNFAAGRVARAPRWMQSLGVEWVWRIFQEPALWRRYLSDGYHMLGLFCFRLAPYAVWRKIHARQLSREGTVAHEISEGDKVVTITLEGDCTQGNIHSLRTLFAGVAKKRRSIELDLSEAGLIDGAFLGLCLLLYRHVTDQQLALTFVGVGKKHRKVFRWNCAEYLL